MSEEATEEVAVETPAETPEAPAETPQESVSLMGERPDKPEESSPEPKEESKVLYDDIDPRLFKDNNEFNADGAKEFLKEVGEKEANLNKRLADMRKMVSTKDDFVESKEEYFQDFAPPEQFMKYFDEKTPDATKEVMKGITDKLADKFDNLALNRRQANDVSVAILEIMSDVGVLDTRTEEQQYIDQKKWVDGQKKQLGDNAENIIRETKEFIFNSNAFTSESKNKLIDMMESQGADFIGAMHQVKGAFGQSTGGVPTNITNLSGLAPDAELAREYLNKDTTDHRRMEIENLRIASGRPGKMMAALDK